MGVRLAIFIPESAYRSLNVSVLNDLKQLIVKASAPFDGHAFFYQRSVGYCIIPFIVVKFLVIPLEGDKLFFPLPGCKTTVINANSDGWVQVEGTA